LFYKGKTKESKMLSKLMAGMTAFAAVMLTSGVAAASDGSFFGTKEGAMAFAVAIGIGIAAAFGTYSQSRAASAALEGISRNPNAADKVFVPMILGLAFIESLVLFTWVLMFLLMGKIPG
jgi:F-type H+-transporting ATPase subunit c